MSEYFTVRNSNPSEPAPWNVISKFHVRQYPSVELFKLKIDIKVSWYLDVDAPIAVLFARLQGFVEK